MNLTIGIGWSGVLGGSPAGATSCDLQFIGDGGISGSFFWEDVSESIAFGYDFSLDIWAIFDNIVSPTFRLEWDGGGDGPANWFQDVPPVDPGVDEIVVDYIVFHPDFIYPTGVPTPRPGTFGGPECGF